MVELYQRSLFTSLIGPYDVLTGRQGQRRRRRREEGGKNRSGGAGGGQNGKDSRARGDRGEGQRNYRSVVVTADVVVVIVVEKANKIIGRLYLLLPTKV